MNKQKYDKQPPAKCIKESQSETMKRKMEARRKIEDMAERMFNNWSDM